MARAPAGSLCLLALGACQAVFGLDETEPPSSAAGAAASGGSAAASSDSSGAAGAPASSTGSGGAAGGDTGGGGPGGGGSAPSEDCGPDQPGEELLDYGDMESGVAQPGDGSWSAFAATLDEETSIVQAGQKAGLLCATTPNQEFFSAYIDVLDAAPIEVGQRYVASACVRSHPAHPAPQYGMVRLREQGGNQPPIDADGEEVPVGDQFTRIVTPEMVVTDPDNDKVTFHVLGWDTVDNVCIVFDSAHVVRLP